jgi:hypothetical protein
MPKGLRRFEFIFERSGLTRFGGLSLFGLFCKSLRIRHFLQLQVRWPSYTHRNYHPVDLLMAHVFAIAAGLGIQNVQSLIHNGLIPPLLGLPNFPHHDTLRSFLWRFRAEHLHRLQKAHDLFRAGMAPRLNIGYAATVDADTTALVTYGHQEGVAVGYLPKRRHGHVSYAPMISSEARCGLSLGLELRPGNMKATTGAVQFLKTMLAKIPSTVACSRTRVRLDAAFYCKDVVQFLDEEGIGYTIVAHLRRPLKARMIEAPYHPFAQGWEAGEFPYTPFWWNEPHRFVAVRRPAALEPESIQKRLFTFRDYTYHRAVVTNLDLAPEAVWRFYCDRGSQELLLREFKDAHGLAQTPTRSYWTNATYMEIILWAYDLVRAFQHLCLPSEARAWNMSTLRRELWWIPAQWVKHGDRNLLYLPARYPQQDLFLRIHRAALRAAPLFWTNLQ